LDGGQRRDFVDELPGGRTIAMGYRSGIVDKTLVTISRSGID
jgi:hypothetical protein